MSYNPNIPNLSDIVLLSGQELKGNWQTAFNAFFTDHVPFSAPNAGMHNALTLRNQSGDPTTSSTQVALYAKNGTGTVPQLFFRPASNGTPIQLSAGALNTGNSQYSFLSGPFQFYFGLIPNIVDQQVITLTPSSTLISVILTVTSKNQLKPKTGGFIAANASNLSTNTFKIQCPFQANGNIQGVDISYLAIGLIT